MDPRTRWLVAAMILLSSALVAVAAGILTYATDHSFVASTLTGSGAFAGTALFIVSFVNHVRQLGIASGESPCPQCWRSRCRDEER